MASEFPGFMIFIQISDGLIEMNIYIWFTALHKKFTSIHIHMWLQLIKSRLIKSSFEPQNHTNDVVAKYLVFQKRSK